MTSKVVLVCAADPVRRAGMRSLVECGTPESLVFEAGSRVGAAQSARANQPAVAVVADQPPIMDGVAVVSDLASGTWACPVLMITESTDPRRLIAALLVGAIGLLGYAQAHELSWAVHGVANGFCTLSADLAGEIFRFLRPGSDEDPRWNLTSREREVLCLMATGLSNSEIATRMVLGERTVKFHVSNVLAKINARDRVHAVVRAHECGMVPTRPGPW